MGWRARPSDAVGRAVVPETRGPCATGLIAVGRCVGRRAVVEVSTLREVATPPRPTNRPRRATSKAVVPSATASVRSRRARQASPSVPSAAAAGDPCAAVPSIGLVTPRLSAVAALAAPVPIQVPVGPLAVLARGPPAPVVASALAEPSRVARRPAPIRQGVRPRPIGGVGTPLSAIEAVVLRLMATVGRPIRSSQPAP